MAYKNLFLYIQSMFPYRFGNVRDSPEQVRKLIHLIERMEQPTVFQTGFQCGYSTEIMLDHGAKSVVSVDLGEIPEVSLGSDYLKSKYGEEAHTLYIGDSKILIPELIKSGVLGKYDMFFIDGGHDFETAYADILNCAALANPANIIIMDDTFNNFDVRRAWQKAISKGVVEPIDEEDFGTWIPASGAKGMSWGRYV